MRPRLRGRFWTPTWRATHTQYYGNALTWAALELVVLHGQTRAVAELTFGLLWRRVTVSDTLSRVDCQRFTNFQDTEQARERDLGARGQGMIGQEGFAAFGAKSLGGRCTVR